MAQRSCCVPGCSTILGGGLPLHRFPNPNKPTQIERFRTWVMKIGGDVIGEDNEFIHKNRKVCHKHFEDVYTFPNMKLTALAIPTLEIPGVHLGESRDIEPPSTPIQMATASSTIAIHMDSDLSSRAVMNIELPSTLVQIKEASSTRSVEMDTDMSSRPVRNIQLLSSSLQMETAVSARSVQIDTDISSNPGYKMSMPLTATEKKLTDIIYEVKAQLHQAHNRNKKLRMQLMMAGWISPRGEHKRPRLTQSKRLADKSYAQAASAPLNVAITCDRTGIISKEASDQVLAAIQRQIINEACSPTQDTPGPTFNAEPMFAEGVLKLWCGNDHTLNWLKRAVSGLALPTSTTLVVKSMSELPTRARCGVIIPDEHGVFKEPTNIGRAISYQNPWVDVKKWVLHFANKEAAAWFVVVSIPEDQISTLMKAGRRLSIGLGAVYVRFQGWNGRFTDVPWGWDPTTETIRDELKRPPTTEATTPATHNPVAAAAATTTAKLAGPDAADVGATSQSGEEPDDSLSSGSDLEGFDEGESRDEDPFEFGRDEEGATSDGVPFVTL